MLRKDIFRDMCCLRRGKYHFYEWIECYLIMRLFALSMLVGRTLIPLMVKHFLLISSLHLLITRQNNLLAFLCLEN